MLDSMQIAIQHHQAGRLDEAGHIYQSVLARNPNDPDALHLLGLVAHQLGQPQPAAQLMSRAIGIRPSPVYYANLAGVWRALGQLDKAVECCRTALALCPACPEAANHLGLALMQQGKLAQAIEQFRAALLVRPNFAIVHTNLADALRTQGDLESAIKHYRKATECDPNLAAAWRNLGNALLASGNARECIAYYQQALRLQPDFVEVYNFLGVAFNQLEDWDKAVACFQEAIRINPSYVPAYNNMGHALRGQGKWPEALTAFRQALQLQPDSAYIAFNLGVVLEGQGQLTQAVDYYRQALHLKPGSFLIRNQLAGALKDLGSFEEAIDQLRESIRLQPSNVVAHAELANFAAEGIYPIQPDEINRLKALLDSGRGSAADLSLCCFALGAMLDKQGLYDEAFGYFQRANDLRKRIFQEHNLAFDAHVHHAFVDRIIAAHSRSSLEQVKDWGVASDLPIFIVGMPRSGSTLLEQILASHPLVFGTGELDDIYRFVTQRAATKKSDFYTSALLPNAGVTAKLAADYLKYLANLGQAAARVTVKTNENFLHLGLIATLFPRARIIHCRRDPLDICLSCYFQNFRTADFAWSLPDIGAYYRAYERVMAHWSAVLPVEIHELCYEDLVRDQETVTRGLLAFCGLDWDERCLSFYDTRRAVRTASSVQVRKPISARAIGRWKHYRSHLEPLFQALGRSA